jgi:anti-anti-sigma factor
VNASIVTCATCSVFVGHVNGRAFVRVSGEVDIASVSRLEEALDLSDGPLDLDCRQLDFIDAAGLGALVRAVNSHGSVTLLNPSPTLVRLLKITELDRVINVDHRAS